MYSLDKVHVGQSKREFKRATAAADAEEVRQAFLSIKDIVINANLYSLEITAYIKRIVDLYCYVATAKIATGTVTEDWTRKKKLTARYIEYIVEKVLEQKLHNGDDFKSELVLDLDTYQKEYLANARREFFDKTQWLPPEGNFEKIYIPMIETCIESIYRIYCLYQIENISNADLRNRELDDETLSLILTVQRVAQERVQTLLEPLDPKNLKQAVAILDNIEKEYDRLSVMSAAAESSTAQSNKFPPKINLTRFLTVNGAFAIELDKREKLDEDEALRNIGTLAKRATAVAAGMAGTATNMMTYGAAYLSDKAMDYITGAIPAESDRLRKLRREAGYDSDDEEDDYYQEEARVVAQQKASSESLSSIPLAKVLSTPPPSYEELIDLDYEKESSATTQTYRPSIPTALPPTVSSEQTVTNSETQALEFN